MRYYFPNKFQVAFDIYGKMHMKNMPVRFICLDGKRLTKKSLIIQNFIEMTSL